MEVDVVVIGSGAGGLTAAFTAAKAGLEVLVVESTPFFGGTTALSGGGVWIPLNHHMKELCVEDSRAEAEAYLKAVLGDFFDAEKVRAYLDTAPEMLAWLEANSEVLLTASASTYPDYAPDADGWKTGRCLLTADYDGTKLGALLEKLRPPISEMGLFHSMQISPADAYVMRQWNRSWPAFRLTVKRMGHYAIDRLRRRHGTHLANGNALAGRMLKSVVDSGVTLWDRSRAKRLVLNETGVVAVLVERAGKQERVTVRKGAILASGGFGANPAMRRRYLPQADAGWSLQPEGCQGDGIIMGIEAGGKLNESNESNAIWVPASATRRRDGSLAKFPSLFFDRHCPGSILIDGATGQRFVNESFHYQNFGLTAQRKSITKIWMISDAAAIRKYGMGMVKPAPFSVRPWVKKGYVVEANSIAELAVKIGAKGLEQTVEDFNHYADAGHDPDFHRGSDAYSAYMGDFNHKPNPALGAIRTGPFYALEVRSSDLCTLAGLKTNAQAQVLDDRGAPIGRLYAAGLDNNTMMGGRYPGGGASIGPAMTFGHIAARHIAAQ